MCLKFGYEYITIRAHFILIGIGMEIKETNYYSTRMSLIMACDMKSRINITYRNIQDIPVERWINELESSKEFANGELPEADMSPWSVVCYTKPTKCALSSYHYYSITKAMWNKTTTVSTTESLPLNMSFTTDLT